MSTPTLLQMPLTYFSGDATGPELSGLDLQIWYLVEHLQWHTALRGAEAPTLD